MNATPAPNAPPAPTPESASTSPQSPVPAQSPLKPPATPIVGLRPPVTAASAAPTASLRPPVSTAVPSAPLRSPIAELSQAPVVQSAVKLPARPAVASPMPKIENTDNSIPVFLPIVAGLTAAVALAFAVLLYLKQ